MCVIIFIGERVSTLLLQYENKLRWAVHLVFLSNCRTVDKVSEKLLGSRVYSVLDLKERVWQLQIARNRVVAKVRL